jgi:hypothetical protein
MGESSRLSSVLTFVGIVLIGIIIYDAAKPYILVRINPPQTVVVPGTPTSLDQCPKEALDFASFAEKFKKYEAGREIYKLNGLSPTGEVGAKYTWIGKIRIIGANGTDMFIVPIVPGFEDVSVAILKIDPAQIKTLRTGDQVKVSVEIESVSVLGAIAHLSDDKEKRNL